MLSGLQEPVYSLPFKKLLTASFIVLGFLPKHCVLKLTFISSFFLITLPVSIFHAAAFVRVKPSCIPVGDPGL